VPSPRFCYTRGVSTWETRGAIQLLRALTQFYYRRKYGAMAQSLGWPDVAPDGRRGFIVIQVDGLAHDHLLEALRAGEMPHLRRMLDDGRLALTAWPCGLPSSTPAVQAAIMFGSREDVPGFRWYEKESGLAFVAKRPDQVQALQARIKGDRVGILIGGSSYGNMFDGDAELALFTLAALPPRRFFESVRGMGAFLLFLLSPFRILRVIGLTILGYLRALTWRGGVHGHRAFWSALLLNPLAVAAVNALFTEAQTFGVVMDIYRRVPAIYVNYNTYDEAAHRFGATHRAAFSTLRDIDRRIGQIEGMRRRTQGREYDLFVLSDHGNTPSLPFSRQARQSLGEFIASHLGHGISLDEVFSQPSRAATKARYLLDEVSELEPRVPPRVRRMLQALRHSMDRRVPADPETATYDLQRREDVVVRVSGPLAHVYFNVAPRRLELIEVALLYPQLLDRLAATERVGLVVGRAGERTVVLGPGGGSAVIAAGRVEVELPNPLAPYGDFDSVARQLHELAGFPHSGDLILLGAMRVDGRVVAFEEQVATHGGLGGPQGTPFIAWPAAVELEPVEGPQDLYRFFRARYAGGQAGG